MQERIYIDRMAQGPEAVGRLSSGKAVFVPGAAPGDVALVDVVEEKAKFARANLVSLVESSQVRVRPQWGEPVADALAPWQHLDYSYQLEAKRANVLSSLTRIGGYNIEEANSLVLPVQASKRRWGYRNKLEFGVGKDSTNRLFLGFTALDSSEVLLSPQCPLGVRTIENAGKSLQGALRYVQGSTDLGIFRVGIRSSLRTGETEIALWTPPSSFPRAEVVNTLGSALRNTSIVRVLADPGKARKIKKVEVLSGKGCWSESLSSVLFKASAPSFFQVNTAQAEKLVKFVIEHLGGAFDEDGPYGLDDLRIADLYAGGGTFSIPLALAGADVTAVEAEGSSVRDLRRNAETNGVYVDAVGGDVARILPTLTALDALVVDPPRSGLAESVIDDIASIAPQKLFYISCNPATWARDVMRFDQKGFHLSAVQPVDLFPQTYHVEVASCFIPS